MSLTEFRYPILRNQLRAHWVPLTKRGHEYIHAHILDISYGDATCLIHRKNFGMPILLYLYPSHGFGKKS